MAVKRTKGYPETDPEKINTYGLDIVEGASQFDYDSYAFSRRIGVEAGAPTRMQLFRTITDFMMPGHFDWNEWTERIVNPLLGESEPTLDGKTVILRAMPGCSNSAKTYNTVGFATAWWAVAPERSSVTLVSTTIKSLRRRGWAELQRAYAAIPNPRPGNFVDSRLLWQYEKGDDKHAIIGKAVEEGPVHKVADDIKGVHTERQMIIIDEATSVPEAILVACANLYSYPNEFILVLLGNPWKRLDQFGRFCEPNEGWNSVGVDTEEWDAKPFEYCGGLQPHVVRFDAEKSPNITEGKMVCRHLPKKEQVDNAKRNSGGGSTPHYWQNMRGFWPPEGLTKTVFTESAILKFDAKGTMKFTGEQFSIIGTFDPAYGGDRPVLRFGKMGMLENGFMGIQALLPIVIPIDITSSNPIHYQLAEQVKRACESVQVGPYIMSCPPENLGVDDSGEGGLCDIFYRTWSPKIIRIEFGGSASESPVSLEDIRPAKEVYRNKRAEMFFHSRAAMDSGQLKGIDDETAIELCNIEFEMSGGKFVLMDKKLYREKFHSSPDLADSLVMLPEVARQKGFKLTAVGEMVNAQNDWEETIKASQAVYATSDYMAPEEDVEIEEPVL